MIGANFKRKSIVIIILQLYFLYSLHITINVHLFFPLISEVKTHLFKMKYCFVFY